MIQSSKLYLILGWILTLVGILLSVSGLFLYLYPQTGSIGYTGATYIILAGILLMVTGLIFFIVHRQNYGYVNDDEYFDLLDYESALGYINSPMNANDAFNEALGGVINPFGDYTPINTDLFGESFLSTDEYPDIINAPDSVFLQGLFTQT